MEAKAEPEWVVLMFKMPEIRPITTNIILYCKAWEKAVRFYRDDLNLPVNFATDWFVEFRLNPVSRLSVADERRSSIKSCGGGGVTVTLEVENIEQMRAWMEKAGLRPTLLKTHSWNARVFYLFDPEGHRIEVWQTSNPDRVT